MRESKEDEGRELKLSPRGRRHPHFCNIRPSPFGKSPPGALSCGSPAASPSLTGIPVAPRGSLRSSEGSDASQRSLHPSPYLVERMAHGKLPQHSQAEGLSNEVGPQQVGDGLVAVEFSIAHPCLGQQPVPLRVTGQEDGATGSRGLAELGVGKEGELDEGRDLHTQGSPGGRLRGV